MSVCLCVVWVRVYVCVSACTCVCVCVFVFLCMSVCETSPVSLGTSGGFLSWLPCRLLMKCLVLDHAPSLI